MNTRRRRKYMGLARMVLLFVVMSGLFVPQATAEVSEIVRVSFTTSSDGEGQVIRLHASGPLGTGDLEVHQESLNEAFILVRGARLSGTITRDRAVDPVSAYQLSSTENDVRINLQFDGYRPVRVIAYADLDSNDGLISVHYASVRLDPGIAPVLVRQVSNGGSDDPDGRWILDCVVIDAGHGGDDLGAVANGQQEKDINLQVAKLLGSYVEDELDLRVVYTRDTDRFVPLEERGLIANEQCGKLFISLHVNSAPSRIAEGTEIYFLGLHKTDEARDVMERENSVIRLESDPDQYAAFGDDQFILQTLAQSVYLRESEALASFVDEEFGRGAKREGRGVKQAGFLVLWKASMPAILVELGFVTNRKEAAFLKSSDGQDLLARAVFRAIQSYRDLYQKGFTPPEAD